jgi:predicted transcriptional regulator
MSVDVRLDPDLTEKLNALATELGRSPEELVQDAVAGYVDERDSVRATLDARYDDIKSGRVQPIDGEEAFARLRARSTIRRTGRE